ncbi:mRNA-decapping enzyme 1A-like [Uloborus diversus]|uniref:mRNA-decapping enzyme 1A-like n=1 Tax=Uloborus diversus TaxID=327109 RepID=UPI002409BF1F|nr:mRNA-decapping enzyme 1A-like [Uloborus diversus]
MAAHSETEINLKTLKRVDPNIIEIIDNASQVAIYRYERKLEKWEGTDIEGTLFLYRRSLFPHHGFIIVNRMSTTNFIESITNDMQFQLQEPYLLYKNHAGDIIGSWFYEDKDLRRISNKIQTIVLKQTSTPRRQRCASESETLPKKDETQDIITLLSQAHEKYVKEVEIVKEVVSSSEDVNNLSTHPEKKMNNKCVKASDKKLKAHGLRSSSQEYPTSPRRRFLSTGSFDPSISKSLSSCLLSSESELKNSSHLSATEFNKISSNIIRPDDFISENVLTKIAQRLPPTRLSPLFSRSEILSPAVSDVALLDDSYEESEVNIYS